MLHGFGSSLQTWDSWAQVLSADHRVLRLDLPGAGLTGADPGNDYSDEHALRLLLGLMDTLGIARASVVGHSMGGRLAWRLAAEYPERVDRLVLIAPDGFASAGFEYGKAPEVPAMAYLMTRMLPRAVVRASLESAWAEPARLDEETVTRYHEMLLAPGVRGALIERMRQMNLLEPGPLLARITAPTLLLWGEQDAMIPVAHAQDYLRALPAAAQARLATLPGVGHLPQEERPADGLAVLQAFLAGRPPPEVAP
jgi:pimeloyl-ACP methyl ester carboxylesterase